MSDRRIRGLNPQDRKARDVMLARECARRFRAKLLADPVRYEAHKKRRREHANANYNPDQMRKWRGRLSEEKKAEQREKARQWKIKNKKWVQGYVRNNPDKYAGYCAIRRHKLRTLKIPGIKKRIALIYMLAKCLTKLTGIKHEVDHIFPINGKTFSGLHVPWNLRAVPALDNRKKSNKIILEIITHESVHISL